MTTIFFIAFFVLVFFFTGKVVADVKENFSRSFGVPNNVKKYFAEERVFLKRYVILAVIATIAILIFGKVVAVFALGVIFIIGIFFLYKLYKNSEDNVDGKTERLAVRIFSLEKFIMIYGIAIILANFRI